VEGKGIDMPSPSASERFSILCEAISNKKQDAGTFRESLMKAYNCLDEVRILPSGEESDLTEIATREKECAERCLKGIGPDENEAMFGQGDLRSVLAKEIGTRVEEHKMIPWLGGDWVSMARIIIHNADLQIGVADGETTPEREYRPEHIIRVWPISGIIGSPKVLPMQRTQRWNFKIGKGGSSTDIFLQLSTVNQKYTAEDYSWVILAEPPALLGKIADTETGLSMNLWKGLVRDPGTKQ
jgi:hypothetical protein